MNKTNTIRELVKKYDYFFLSIVILCFYSLYNKYPILMSLTGEYIKHGFSDGHVFNYSNYGLFVLHISWAWSLWLVVFFQSFIVCLLLYWIFDTFNLNYISAPVKVYFFVFIMISAFLTTGSYTISSITKEVFRPVIVLACLYILQVQYIRNYRWWICCSVILLSIFIDYYNVAFPLLLLSFFIYRSLKIFISFKLVRIFLVVLLFSIVWGLYVCLFLKIPFDQFSNHFTPINLLHLSHNFFSFSGGEYHRLNQSSITFSSIIQWFNWEVREFMISRQFQNWLNLKYLCWSQAIILVGSVVVYFILWIRKRNFSIDERRMTTFILLAVFISEVILPKDYTGAFMEQGLIWLVPLPIFLIFMRNFSTRGFTKTNNYVK